MKGLVIFSEALCLPVAKNEIVQAYGLVVEKEHWELPPYSYYSAAFLTFLRVVSEMVKKGFEYREGLEFVKNGEFFHYDDLICRTFVQKVEECGVKYATVGECIELKEGDSKCELFTNKEKWQALVGRKDLEWKR